MKMTSLKHPVQGMDEKSVSPDRNVGKVFSCVFFFLSVFHYSGIKHTENLLSTWPRAREILDPSPHKAYIPVREYKEKR